MNKNADEPPSPKPAPRYLSRARLGFAHRLDEASRRARGRLARLALAKSFGPLALWLMAGLILALAGLPMRPELAITASLGFYIGCAWLTWRAVRRYRPLHIEDGRRAIDRLMEGEPASTQYDTPVPDTALGRDFLAIHAERMAVAARSLTAPTTAAQWRRADPLRLRWIGPICTVVAFFFAADETTDRILAAARVDIGVFAGAHRMTMQAWVTPPAYTGLAPFHLENGESAEAPEGSTVTVRLQGSGRPKLRLVAADGSRSMLEAVRGADGVFSFGTSIVQSVRGEVLLFGVRKKFALTSIADTPPEAVFSSIPETGEDDTLQFGWYAEDDYGVSEAFLDIRLADPEQPHSDLVTTLSLPMSRVDPQRISEEEALDLTKHQWAGLKVKGNVIVRDARGQSGQSATAFFTLPEKLFLVPLALASVEVRSSIMREQGDYDGTQDAEAVPDDAPSPVYATQRVSRLAAAPDAISRAAKILDALTAAPVGAVPDLAVFLGLRYAHELLESADSTTEAKKAEEVLWQVALRAELGSLADAARALKLAREQLEEALRDGADDQEVNRRIEALRQAIDRYTELAIARALEQGNFASGPGGGEFDIDNFEEMLRALEDLAGTGARDQARQLLADMYSLLQSMQNLQLRSGGGGRGIPGQENPEASETDRQVEELADLLRDQRQLNDDTYRLGQQERRQRGQQPGGSETEDGESSQSLGERQEELRRRLGRMGENGEKGIRELLDEVLDQQESARDSLSEGDPNRAVRPQSEASESLREAITELADKADRERSDGDNEGVLDPLDRPSQGEGRSDRVMIPDEAERKRARDILDELLRRSMDPAIDEEQGDYLQRLLKRF